MMRPPTSAPVVRGRVLAHGFVVDPAVLGADEARRRVLSEWTTGCRLRVLSDGAWLLVLPVPVSVRAERAAGAVADAGPGGLLTVWRGGRRHDLAPDGLASVDTTGWVDVADLPVHLLRPVEAPAAEAPQLGAAPEHVVDLGPVVGLAAPRLFGRSGEVSNRGSGGPLFWGWRRGWGWGRTGGAKARSAVAIIGVMGALAVLVALVASAADDGPGTAARPPGAATPTVTTTPAVTPPPAPAPPPEPEATSESDSSSAGSSAGSAAAPWFTIFWAIAAIGFSAARTRVSRKVRARVGAPASARRRLLPRFLASPFGVVARSRHERYLHGLTRSFERGDFDTALRRAVALQGLGASGRAGWTVRLPRPRLGALGPTVTAGGAGVAFVSHLNMWHYLRELYEQVATDLERRGRVDEAAFVRADLLHDSLDAVQLLERNDRRVLAAELAEGRKLAPDLVVRLWWQAGRRQRAIDAARLRGGLEEAARRMQDVDADAALELRALWVTRLLEAGDVLAAVRAAWPYPTLHPLVVPHLGAAVAAGGPDGARVLVHVIAKAPTDDELAAAEGLLTTSDSALLPARVAFVTALAEVTLDDAAADRRICSAAVRQLLAEPSLLGDLPKKSAGVLVRGLVDRADAMLGTDAPAVAVVRALSTTETRTVTAAGAGAVATTDAVALPAGLLVAHGAGGVRLLTPDGRVRARWDVAADQIVPADHGFAALLVRHGERTVEVHRLDLRTMRVRRWAWLPDVRVAETFDGALLAVLDQQGLAILDTTDDVPLHQAPRTVWREFEPGVAVLGLVRGGGWMSALVRGEAVDVTGRPQMWTWSQPGTTLRDRTSVAFVPDARTPLPVIAVAAGGALLTLQGDDDDRLLRLYTTGWDQSPTTVPGHGVRGVASTGPYLAVVRGDGESLAVEILTENAARTTVTAGARLPVALQVVFDGAQRVGLRHHGTVVAVHDGAGRVVAADVRSGDVVSNVAVRR